MSGLMVIGCTIRLNMNLILRHIQTLVLNYQRFVIDLLRYALVGNFGREVVEKDNSFPTLSVCCDWSDCFDFYWKLQGCDVAGARVLVGYLVATIGGSHHFWMILALSRMLGASTSY
ncbi:hypothetical protein KFK09_025508 [Dendrobium nobile]|uniref:Uncharacterized protein n=1 Tax=Dendrobium nobile TaxID=94219 RepID=A0A8T3AGS8_DENNO|nr:hypothetical protein KFK09_025508 [Dendrobium nobile]